MGRGRRFEENKLNMKKVFAVILAIVVIIMVIAMVVGIIKKSKDGNNNKKITSESYFASYKDNKWGVINSTGNAVIDPSYREMIIVPNNKKDVFLCTYDVNNETGEYKTKVLNSKNEEIYTDYDKIEAIQNMDKNNNIWYEANVLKVQKDGKYGLINFDGKELVACEYTNITPIYGIENALKVEKDGKFGVLSDEGKSLVSTNYSDVQNLGKDSKAGFIVKNIDGKFGIVDMFDAKILDTIYEGITKIYGNDMYVIIEAGKQKIVKKDGTKIEVAGYDEITSILKTANTGFIFKKDNKYGVMNVEGTVIVEAKYDNLSETKNNIFVAKQADKYGIINLQNEVKVEFKYASLYYNETADIYVAGDENGNDNVLNGDFEVKKTGILIAIDETKGYIELREGSEYKYYNYKFEEKNVRDIFSTNTLFIKKENGKFGFVDKDDKVVIDYIYDDAVEQNSCGYAAVKKDGKWGCIDSSGKVVVEPKYNLNDYLKVDFVGIWHLGKDINMNYYNQLDS